MLMLSLPTRLFLIASNFLVQGYSDKVKISAPSISKKYGMNARALMPSLSRLTQVGTLNSQVGGANPGFILARSPDKITMYEIILALEGEYKTSSCRDIMENVKCDIQNCDNCSIFQSINNGMFTMVNKLKATTLKEHIDSEKIY